MGLIWIALAAVWGVGEATLFFIVPDVLLTALVLRYGLRAALRLAVVAAASASLAGVGMWLWGYYDAASAREAVLWVPAIGPDLLARAHREIAVNWPLHLFTGAMNGVPYKLYAVEAGAQAVNPVLFALVSFPARLARFWLTAGLTAVGSELLSRWGWSRWNYTVLALVWIAIYGTYFAIRATV